MQRLTYRLQQTALRQVLLRRHRVEQLEQRLFAGVQSWTMLRRNHIRMLEQRVETLNPERVYRLGYSLLRKDGRVVRSVADCRQGDTVSAELADGLVQLTVQER